MKLKGNNSILTIFFTFTTGLIGQETMPIFVDVTKNAGLTFEHSFGDDQMSNLIESNGAGCAFFDYDGDRDLDIFFVNGAYIKDLSHPRGRYLAGKLTNALYRNNSDGTFTDVTEQAGLWHEGMGMACISGDYDNDGDADLFVTNWGPNVFYQNNGDGTFTEATAEAGLKNDLWGIGSTFLDYDGDGYLDLYVGSYLEHDPEYRYFYAPEGFPGPLAYHGQPDILYHNNGDGTFEDVTHSAGIYKPEGRAMGVSSCDIDDDGDMDIFVANDAMENYLFRNNGDGTFTDVAIETATGFGQSGEATSAMSGEFGDIDLDGFIDLVVPDMGYGCIYKNTGAGYFEEMSAQMGMAAACGQYTSWSGNFLDYDSDGYIDLFISNGHSQRLNSQEDLILRNDRGLRLVDVSSISGNDFQEKFVGRGSAAGDYDDDGDLDILVLNLNSRPRLLRNEGGNKNNWLMIHVIGTQSNRDGIGTRIHLTAGGIRQTRWIMSASGYLSQSDFRAHFGLGKHQRVEKIELRWPTGNIQTLKDIKVNQIKTIFEPSL